MTPRLKEKNQADAETARERRLSIKTSTRFGYNSSDCWHQRLKAFGERGKISEEYEDVGALPSVVVRDLEKIAQNDDDWRVRERALNCLKNHKPSKSPISDNFEHLGYHPLNNWMERESALQRSEMSIPQKNSEQVLRDLKFIAENDSNGMVRKKASSIIRDYTQNKQNQSEKVKHFQCGIIKKAQEIHGVQFGALMADSNEVRGVQIGAGTNAFNVYGGQISFAADSSNVKGFQIGLYSRAKNVKGAQNGVLAAADKVNGMQNSLLMADADEVHGVQTSPIAVVEEDICGVQNGIIALNYENLHGWQNGILTVTDNVRGGVQNAFVAVTNEDVRGVQNGVTVAANNDVYGAQNGILYAGANNLYGSQRGLITVAKGEDSKGSQTGLLLWGPNNKNYNPSIGFQKLDDSKNDEGNFPTFKRVGKTLKDLLF